MTGATLPPPPEPDERLPAGAVESVLAQAEAAVDGAPEVLDLTPLDHPRRLLLVHAHPDDETIGTGATMARAAAENVAVTLVTCTLGEEGEILVPELEHLAADREDGLGRHRVEELAAAMEALRVTDHRFLGGPGRWRDSGMMGTPANERPECFWQADLGEAVRELVAVVRETRPQVVVTYDERGGYGHPDHVQAHRVTVAAFDAAARPGVRAGARRALAGQQALLDGGPQERAAGRHRRAQGERRHRLLRRRQRRRPAVRQPGRGDHDRGRRHRPPRRQARRACARTARRSPSTGRSSP